MGLRLMLLNDGVAFETAATAAFGESCRRRGHALTARFDPERLLGRLAGCKVAFMPLRETRQPDTLHRSLGSWGSDAI